MGKLIRTSGEMLRRVLDDVLDFSKIEAGKLELEKELFVVRESLERSIGIFRKTAIEKQLQLRLNVDDNIPVMLVGDATRLRQVLTTLISNALKFTEKGCIEVSARLKDNPTEPDPPARDLRDRHGHRNSCRHERLSK
jgi:two-component system, sensor histidine kinase